MIDRPVITFLTDFGPESAPAICRGVMLSIARDAQIVDISHSVRKFAIRDGAYLLWSAVPWMPVGVHVVVVDPGVGTARLGIAIKTARGDVLVGPDNGVLMPAADVLGGAVEARILENRGLMLTSPTSTFHGRDIFAPIGAHLAVGTPFDSIGSVIDTGDLVQLRFPTPTTGPGMLETSIAFVDPFGNLRLFGTPDNLESALGPLVPGTVLSVVFGSTGDRIESPAWTRTFGEIPIGQALLYRDSSGWLAFADNQGNAAGRLGLSAGDLVRIHSPRS